MKGRFAPLTRCPGFYRVGCSAKIDEGYHDLCSQCRKRRRAKAARGTARKETGER